MKKAILSALIGLAIFAGGYVVANTTQSKSICTGGPNCPCDPCPFKK